METQRPPFAGVREFLNDFHQYVTPRDTVDAETLDRYRLEQEDTAPCAVCGRAYVPDCNSGACA